jgi:hypothetical protein
MRAKRAYKPISKSPSVDCGSERRACERSIDDDGRAEGSFSGAHRISFEIHPIAEFRHLSGFPSGFHRDADLEK